MIFFYFYDYSLLDYKTIKNKSQIEKYFINIDIKNNSKDLSRFEKISLKLKSKLKSIGLNFEKESILCLGEFNFSKNIKNLFNDMFFNTSRFNNKIISIENIKLFCCFKENEILEKINSSNNCKSFVNIYLLLIEKEYLIKQIYYLPLSMRIFEFQGNLFLMTSKYITFKIYFIEMKKYKANIFILKNINTCFEKIKFTHYNYLYNNVLNYFYFDIFPNLLLKTIFINKNLIFKENIFDLLIFKKHNINILNFLNLKEDVINIINLNKIYYNNKKNFDYVFNKLIIKLFIIIRNFLDDFRKYNKKENENSKKIFIYIQQNNLKKGNYILLKLIKFIEQNNKVIEITRNFELIFSSLLYFIKNYQNNANDDKGYYFHTNISYYFNYSSEIYKIYNIFLYENIFKLEILIKSQKYHDFYILYHNIINVLDKIYFFDKNNKNLSLIFNNYCLSEIKDILYFQIYMEKINISCFPLSKIQINRYFIGNLISNKNFEGVINNIKDYFSKKNLLDNEQINFSEPNLTLITDKLTIKIIDNILCEENIQSCYIDYDNIVRKEDQEIDIICSKLIVKIFDNLVNDTFFISNKMKNHQFLKKTIEIKNKNCIILMNKENNLENYSKDLINNIIIHYKEHINNKENLNDEDIMDIAFETLSKEDYDLLESIDSFHYFIHDNFTFIENNIYLAYILYKINFFKKAEEILFKIKRCQIFNKNDSIFYKISFIQSDIFIDLIISKIFLKQKLFSHSIKKCNDCIKKSNYLDNESKIECYFVLIKIYIAKEQIEINDKFNKLLELIDIDNNIDNNIINYIQYNLNILRYYKLKIKYNNKLHEYSISEEFLNKSFKLINKIDEYLHNYQNESISISYLNSKKYLEKLKLKFYFLNGKVNFISCKFYESIKIFNEFILESSKYENNYKIENFEILKIKLKILKSISYISKSYYYIKNYEKSNDKIYFGFKILYNLFDNIIFEKHNIFDLYRKKLFSKLIFMSINFYIEISLNFLKINLFNPSYQFLLKSLKLISFSEKEMLKNDFDFIYYNKSFEKILNTLSKLFYYKNLHNLSIQYLCKLLEFHFIFKFKGFDCNFIKRIFEKIGINSMRLEQYENAIDYFFDSLKYNLYNKRNNLIEVGNIYQLIGDTYRCIFLNNKSNNNIEYRNKSLSSVLYCHNKQMEFYHYALKIYLDKKTLIKLMANENCTNENKSLLNNLIKLYLKMGDIYFENNSYLVSLNYYINSLSYFIFLYNETKFDVCILNLKIFFCYEKLNDLYNMRIHLNKCISIYTIYSLMEYYHYLFNKIDLIIDNYIYNKEKIFNNIEIFDNNGNIKMILFGQILQKLKIKYL